MLTGRDVFLIPFSLVWLGFVCFWLFGVTMIGAPPEFLLFGLVFLIVGLSMTFGRFALDAFVRSRTLYAVTTHRVLIDRQGPFGTFTAIALDRLPAVKLKPRGNDRGTIVFGDAGSPFAAQMSIWTPSLDPTPQFLSIPDARRVYALIQRAQG